MRQEAQGLPISLQSTETQSLSIQTLSISFYSAFTPSSGLTYRVYIQVYRSRAQTWAPHPFTTLHIPSSLKDCSVGSTKVKGIRRGGICPSDKMQLCAKKNSDIRAERHYRISQMLIPVIKSFHMNIHKQENYQKTYSLF